ncbi:hypothetical protein F4780DRAFT_783816 [Xylariomycetidae sp. FL0641]|nr:hypothetical protein F4780DRAFT_783816 [Xylariomycetidae sp. FL0641]
MSTIARLNDVGIALNRVLVAAGVRHGIFGGYAISNLKGPRVTKDVDCLANADRHRLVQLLDKHEGFTVIPQEHQDRAVFLWSGPDRDPVKTVRVNVYCTAFPGSIPGMVHFAVKDFTVQGEQMGEGKVGFLDPIIVFNGKMQAAATRDKFYDSADLRWLADHYPAHIAPRAREIDLVRAGLAIKRYPELERTLASLGVDVQEAKASVAPIQLKDLPAPASGHVQRGLLC